MNDRPELADRIALAILEHGPSPGSDLALRVQARKATVLAELRSNRMFEQFGHRRGSRWRLAGNRYEPAQEPLGPNHGDHPTSDLADRMDALERRLDAIERQIVEARAT